MDLIIRPERADDYLVVEELTREAFWNLHVPGCDEHFVLHNLRKCPAFIPELDLVAEKDGTIVGHIVYSASMIVDNEANVKHEVITFGPVSVLPSMQRQGIGSALIKHSLARAKQMGFPAVCIYGDPRYYSKFGFRCTEKFDIKTANGKFAVALLALELRAQALQNVRGRFYEDPAFDVNQDEFDVFEKTFAPKEKKETDTQLEFRLLAGLTY